MSTSASDSVKMEDIVNLCKKKGFIFQSNEIYDPIAGFFDYGPLGVEMRNNIKKIWWRDMVQRRDDVVGIDCAIIGSHQVYKASGHIDGFSDPMVNNCVCIQYESDVVLFFFFFGNKIIVTFL